MKPITTSILRFTAFVALAALACAQEPQPAGPPPQDQQQQPSGAQGGWRRVGDTAPAPDSSQGQYPQPSNEGQYPQDQYPPPPNQQRPYPQASSQGQYPQGQYPQGQPTYGSQYPVVPSELTVRPGTYLTVRVDQPLSSDHNRPGDAFTATLVKPLVVDGVVVAQAGQTLGGRVTEAQKAGRVQGTSRLGVEIIDLNLVDGQQIPVKTSFVSMSGSTSVGRDAGAIATTTGVGAAIGAAAEGGVGAGIGAAAGAGAGLIGVLLTRGRATILYPEEVLTFRMETPVTISTARAPQAFRFVEPQEYQRAANSQQRFAQRRPMPPPAYYPPLYGPVWGGYPYPYYYGPGYWGPSFSFFYGRGFYGRGYYGHPFYRGYRR